jgi:hypothetical protein
VVAVVIGEVVGVAACVVVLVLDGPASGFVPSLVDEAAGKVLLVADARGSAGASIRPVGEV